MKFAALKDEYSRLWASMYVHTKWRPAVDASARKILSNKERYQAVAAMTRVPWFVIGLMHQMESGCNFGCHLHNGDPLARRTVQVPKGRPLAGLGPFKWETSACDALLMKGLEQIGDWPIERICYELERFNGWGYRKYHPTTLSPYLWSGTAHYARGKYIADGKWSSSAVSGQTGAMPLLKKLTELDPSILGGAPAPAADPEVAEPPVSETVTAPLPLPATVPEVSAPGPVESTPDTSKKATEKRVPWWAKILGWFGIGATAAETAPLPSPPDLSPLTAWQSVGDTAGATASWAMSKPLLLILVVGWISAMIFLPKIAERFGWAR